MPTEYYKLAVTNKQRQNLEILYKHLEKVETIEMSEFTSLEAARTPEFLTRHHTCDTVCCLAGNGPLAGIAAKSGEFWFEYVERVFGAEEGHENEDKDRLWAWLFDANWAFTDNTVTGGRARIRMALDHGIPVNYGEQLRGSAPLSYL